MYGIINVAIKDFAVANFGPEKWEAIREHSGVDVDFSLTENAYNDNNAYKLAEAAADEMHLDLEQVLNDFGESVIETTNIKYNGFMDSRGSNLKDYLVNLPNFHNRIAMIYPELTPPQFRVSHVDANSLQVHYISKTAGMKAFITGYLNGLVKIFNEKATVSFLQSKNEGSPQEIFKISW